MKGTEEASELAWTFTSRLRVALLARLGERMLASRWAITPEGRAALAADHPTERTES